MGERMMQHQKDLCIAFIDYTKAFDRENHRKLIDIMKFIGDPFHETRHMLTYTGNKVQKYDTKVV